MHRVKLRWTAANASFWFLPNLIVALSIALRLTLMHVEDSALAGWMRAAGAVRGQRRRRA